MTTQTDSTSLDMSHLVQEYRSRIWRYLRFLGAPNEQADDLTQETFVAVLKHPFEERDPRATSTYLRTTARNLFLMSRRGVENNIVIQNPELAESVWEKFEKDDGGERYLDALADCLEGVNGRARQAIQLQYSERKSRLDIAEILDMTPDGVKTLLRRTRSALRDCIHRKVES